MYRHFITKSYMLNLTLLKRTYLCQLPVLLWRTEHYVSLKISPLFYIPQEASPSPRFFSNLFRLSSLFRMHFRLALSAILTSALCILGTNWLQSGNELGWNRKSRIHRLKFYTFLHSQLKKNTDIGKQRFERWRPLQCLSDYVLLFLKDYRPNLFLDWWNSSGLYLDFFWTITIAMCVRQRKRLLPRPKNDGADCVGETRHTSSCDAGNIPLGMECSRIQDSFVTALQSGLWLL